MLLPYWTNNCVDSMEGLLFESSATTPYHFLDQAELSTAPSDAQANLPYGSLNVVEGVEHLQMLGVKYYIAFSSNAIAEASSDPRSPSSRPPRPGPVPGSSGTSTRSPTAHGRTLDVAAQRGGEHDEPSGVAQGERHVVAPPEGLERPSCSSGPLLCPRPRASRSSRRARRYQR